ncbi:hypothetical protein HXX01_05560 [Candidatus Nomurabacteria bacterium]|nr:hypothetical protein [Candidatus Nomurabacteria bacterium]
MKKLAIAWYFVGLIVISIAAFSDQEVSKVQGAFIFMAFAIGYPLTIKKAFENNVNGLFFWMLGSSVAAYIALPAIYIVKKDPARKFYSFWYESRECTDNRALVLILNVIIKSLVATNDGLHLYNSILNGIKISQDEANKILKNQNSINVTIPTDRETQLRHICAVLQLANNLKNSSNENVDECLKHLVKCGYDQELIPVAYERLTEAIKAMEEREKEEQEQDYIDAEIINDDSNRAKAVVKTISVAAGSAIAMKSASQNTAPKPSTTTQKPKTSTRKYEKSDYKCATCNYWTGPRIITPRPFNHSCTVDFNAVGDCAAHTKSGMGSGRNLRHDNFCRKTELWTPCVGFNK